jgi:hypothetical protein
MQITRSLGPSSRVKLEERKSLLHLVFDVTSPFKRRDFCTNSLVMFVQTSEQRQVHQNEMIPTKKNAIKRDLGQVEAAAMACS